MVLVSEVFDIMLKLLKFCGLVFDSGFILLVLINLILKVFDMQGLNLLIVDMFLHLHLNVFESVHDLDLLFLLLLEFLGQFVGKVT